MFIYIYIHTIIILPIIIIAIIIIMAVIIIIIKAQRLRASGFRCAGVDDGCSHEAADRCCIFPKAS